jgi:hypothetical protein
LLPFTLDPGHPFALHNGALINDGEDTMRPVISSSLFASHRLLPSLLVAGVFFFLVANGRSVAQECTGACGGDNDVSVADVITCVNVGLGTKDLGECPECSPDDDVVQITDLIEAVDNSMGECPPVDTPTSTPTDTVEATATATATLTLTPTGTATATITPTDTPVVDTPTATATDTPMVTDTPTGTPTATVTGTPTDTAIVDTPTVTPTGTATGTVEATITPTDTPIVDTPTVTPTGTATGTVMATITPTDTPQPPATETPTSTDTPEPSNTPTATNTPEPTPTNTVSCPVEPGNYTLTQVAGGVLTVDGLPSFPFPAGGVIAQTIGAPNADCVHPTTVAFPGGFGAPTFCIPALSFSTSVVQTACGIGLIDSDGGSDFTITETGDTSAPNAPCFLTPSCASGGNSNVRLDVTVGDGTPDTCGEGTANATVTIPVFTTTWLSFAGCPDPDGTFNPPPGGVDTLIVSFPQTLDFTSDTTTTTWVDLDGPDCAIAGAGPVNGFGSTPGTCIDLAGIDTPGVDVTTVASGAIGSSGAPLYDLSFVTVLPNELGTGTGDAATCATPPLINHTGTVTRCVGQ